MAALTFNRPPVMVMPLRESIGSTLLKIVASRVAVSKAQTESTKAAAPETCGVAIEVPLK